MVRNMYGVCIRHTLTRGQGEVSRGGAEVDRADSCHLHVQLEDVRARDRAERLYEQQPAPFLDSVDQHRGNVTSSLLFAYKVNWQPLLFVGLGDEHDVDVADNKLQPAGRQLFMKMSYAFQR